MPWDYQIVPVPAAANALNALTGLGSAGLEVTGGFTAANGTAMLLPQRGCASMSRPAAERRVANRKTISDRN